VRAGISYALAEAMDDGHCGLPAEELVALTRELLEVPTELVEAALGLELQGGAVIADDLEGRRCVFLAGLYRAEREIAEKLKALAVGKPPWPLIDADKAIPWVEKRTKLALADSQQ
jgi:exodeoxyribonuclease V alpha subunit